ncbi:MAG: hypothetical protein L0H54_08230, partial [Alcaligenaceae bacterium]|nr:hypothetical protein [Alcaligenaceae bacterium]
MATVTLGVKIDEALRERLKASAARLGCTPHWLHKQALLAYIDAIERGQTPAEIQHLAEGEQNPDAQVEPDRPSPFHEFAQEVQPQSVLRAAITAAYRRPETECMPMLLDLATPPDPESTQAL